MTTKIQLYKFTENGMVPSAKGDWIRVEDVKQQAKKPNAKKPKSK
jgi:hypothetical protein